MVDGEKLTHRPPRRRPRPVRMSPTRRVGCASATTARARRRGQRPHRRDHTAKRTPELIPLCHSVALTCVTVDLAPDEAGATVTAAAECRDRTGTEMEVMTAATVAALTPYDMVKGYGARVPHRAGRVRREVRRPHRDLDPGGPVSSPSATSPSTHRRGRRRRPTRAPPSSTSLPGLSATSNDGRAVARPAHEA